MGIPSVEGLCEGVNRYDVMKIQGPCVWHLSFRLFAPSPVNYNLRKPMWLQWCPKTMSLRVHTCVWKYVPVCAHKCMFVERTLLPRHSTAMTKPWAFPSHSLWVGGSFLIATDGLGPREEGVTWNKSLQKFRAGIQSLKSGQVATHTSWLYFFTDHYNLLYKS